MSSNANIREYATALAGILKHVADLQDEAKAVLESAKEAGVATSALSKVAREMAMSSDKLAKKLEGEQQLEMFRDEVGLLKLKGLEGLGFDGSAAR